MGTTRGTICSESSAIIAKILPYRLRGVFGLILILVAGIHCAANAAFPIQFAPPINFPAAHSPLCAGDFNGDGISDLAVGYTNGSVAILTNDGTGTLRFWTNFYVLDSVEKLAAGDFNGDSKLDLLVAGGYATVCFNNGNGIFTITKISPYLNATDVAVGDFNRDRRPDVAILGYNLAIFLAQTNGTFMPPTNYSGSYRAMAAADFDGNTRTDLVLTKDFATSTFVLLANADGTFGPATSYAGNNASEYHNRVATADLDRDGKPDLIVGNASYTVSISVRLNYGDGTFGPEKRVSLPNGVPNLYSFNSIATADFDGDGNPDIVVGDPLVILPGLGNGSFATAVTNITSFYVTGSQSLAIADFDGDGRPDIATTSVTNNCVSILLNRTPPPISISIQNTSGLLVLNWPDKAGFNPEFTTNLALPNSWSSVTNPSFVVNGQRIVVMTADGDSRFFRLKK